MAGSCTLDGDATPYRGHCKVSFRTQLHTEIVNLVRPSVGEATIIEETSIGGHGMTGECGYLRH